MNPTSSKFLALICLAILISSCENKKNDNQPADITGELISNSGCKDNYKSAELLDIVPDTLSCVEYSFNEAKNELHLRHINAGFNCCPGELSCTIETLGNTILISEFEEAPSCYCNCLYDLDILVNGVTQSAYKIEFAEPYAEEQEKLVFDIDLSQQTEGTFCVTRKIYPWGMHTILE